MTNHVPCSWACRPQSAADTSRTSYQITGCIFTLKQDEPRDSPQMLTLHFTMWPQPCNRYWFSEAPSTRRGLFLINTAAPSYQGQTINNLENQSHAIPHAPLEEETLIASVKLQAQAQTVQISTLISLSCATVLKYQSIRTPTPTSFYWINQQNSPFRSCCASFRTDYAAEEISVKAPILNMAGVQANRNSFCVHQFCNSTTSE